MEIRFTNRAEKQFTLLPRDLQKRIAKKMRFYTTQQNPLKFAKHLTDFEEGEFRFRVGKQRIIFDVKDNIIYVLKIGPRDKTY